MHRPPKNVSAAWVKLLTDLETEGRRLGATDPQVYIEGNSGLVVLDGPPHDEHDNPRRDAILFILPWPPGKQGSVGAW